MSPVMTDDELLERLFTEEDRLPREAVDEILRRGATLAPRLLEILRDEDLWAEDPPRGWAAIHATFLQAALKPANALEETLLAFERAELYDWAYLLDKAPSILASFAGEGLEPLPSLLRDPKRAEVVRENAGMALLGLAQKNPALRETVGAALRGVAADPGEDEELRTWTASLLLDHADPQDRALLLSFGDNDFFDPQYVKEVFDEGVRAQTVDLADVLDFYDPDAIEARQREADEEGYPGHEHEHEHDEEPLDPGGILPSDPAADVLDAATSSSDAPPPPLRRSEPKVGRNDPCPCGSGAKFKKCCGK